MLHLLACTPATPPAPAPALWFGGDVHLGASARGGLDEIAAAVDGAVGIVNLEGPIGAGGSRIEGDRVWLSNPAEAPGFLRADGVVAASIANNHAEDDGAAGVGRTIEGLRAGGVTPFGGDAGGAVVDVGGVAVRLLAYDLAAGGGAPDGLPPVPPPPGGPRPQSPTATRPAASPADTVTVVAFHVTGPPSYLPRPELVAAVDAAVAGGADIVVAHGTHVVGPVERRGDTVVAWGLGNLLFDCACTDADEAIVLRVALDGGHAAQVLPITAGLGGAPARVAADADGLLDLVDGLGGTPLRRVGGRGEF